jgi:hypothetical protein
MPAQDEGACGPSARATFVRQIPLDPTENGFYIDYSLCHRLGVAGSDGPVAVPRRAEKLVRRPCRLTHGRSRSPPRRPRRRRGPGRREL